MHYFIAAVAFLAIVIAVPLKFVAIIVALILACAAVVKLSAKIVTGVNPAITSCMKAVIYCFIFTIVATIISFKLIPSIQSAALIVVPALVFFAQALAYSSTLNLTLIGGAGVSICVSVVGWGLGYVMGLTDFLLV